MSANVNVSLEDTKNQPKVAREENSGILKLSLIFRFSPRNFPLTTKLYSKTYFGLTFFFFMFNQSVLNVTLINLYCVFKVRYQNTPNGPDFHALESSWPS